jgi:hypothetical protein
VERVRIDSTGNVGIGTTSPGAKLHIIQTTEADASSGLVVQRTTNDSQLQIGYNSSISGFQISPTFGSTGAYTPIALFTSAQERMRILANGNVGIGTTSPTAPLHVTRANNNEWIAKIVNTGTTSYGLSIDTSANPGEYTLAAYTNTGTGLFLRNNGNVGIGTSAPNATLQVNGNTIISGSSNDVLTLYRNTVTATRIACINSFGTGWAGVIGAGMVLGGQAGMATTIYGGGTASLAIDSRGNTAIGKTSPINAKLDVGGDTFITGSGTYALDIASSTGNANLRLIDTDNTTAFAYFTNSSGTGKIGTFGAAMYLGGQSGMGTVIQSNASNVMFINTSGNVAIGKSTPINGKFDVSGSAIISGSLAVTGDITAVGNVTAYFSDDRLKTRLGPIVDPLGKIKLLTGFYFEPNQTAIELGYEKKPDIGISAQDVQAIFPEIIAPAPIDSKYMTVRYEKLIPLLIEAIKLQQSQIEHLQSLIQPH